MNQEPSTAGLDAEPIGAALIVGGPTASGKSALALALARALDGTVINADSMQVYRELRVLTARPTTAQEAAAPHRLYGVRPAAEPGGAGWWREAALAAMGEAWGQGRLPILCGGTGLYFRALTEGLADIPDPGAPARSEARALLDRLGPAGLHRHLAGLDPESAGMLRPSDGQRLARAWEVLAGTGRGLAAWQRDPVSRPVPARFTALRLAPPREALRAAVADRFGQMLAAGALDEVRGLLALGLPPGLPAMRALGVAPLAAHLRGELSLDAAAERAVAGQRQYLKRQATWFAHHPLAPEARTLTITTRIAGMTQFPESEWQRILSFIGNVR